MWYSNGSILNHSMPGSAFSSNCQTSSDAGIEKVAKVVGYTVVMFISLVGNSLVVLVVMRTKDLRGTINYLIVNMALSDFIIPVFVIPRHIANIVKSLPVTGWLISGILGDALCKCMSFLQDLSTAVSVQTLVLITVERFLAVVYPMKVKLVTQRRQAVFIASTWIIGSLVYAPYFYALKTFQKENDSNVYCILSWEPSFDHQSTHRFYTTFTVVIFILLPFTLIVILYIIILLRLKTRGISRYQSGSGREVRRKENRNVLFMAIAIVFAFALCWAPFNIFICLYLFVWNFEIPCVSKNLEFVGYFCAYSISAINPCMYFIFVKRYKDALKSFLLPSVPVKWIRKQSSWTEVETEVLRDAFNKRVSQDIKLSVL